MPNRPRLALLARLWHDQRAAIAPMLAILLPALIGFAALGVEAGSWFDIKRRNQSAADVAAFSGALQIANGATAGSSSVITAVTKDATRNGFVNAAPNTITINSPYNGANNAVEVILKQVQSPLLAKVAGQGNVTITTRAVASITSTSACASGVGSGTSSDIVMKGSPTIDMPGCTLTSNSTGSSSIDLTGGATIDAYTISTAGSISAKGSATLNLTEPATTGAKVVSDPYSTATIATLPTVPTLPTSATAPTFPTLSNAPNTPSVNAQSVATLTCDASKSTASTPIGSPLGSNLCFTNANVTLNTVTFSNKNYFFSGNVTIPAGQTVTFSPGADVQIAGSLTNHGTIVFQGNSGHNNNGTEKLNLPAGSFTSDGTVTFTGDTGGASDYAVSATSYTLGTTSFGGGTYGIYGGPVTFSTGTATFGAADYNFSGGNLTINGTANFNPTSTGSNTSKTTNLVVSAGNFSTGSSSNVTFSGASGTSHLLKVSTGGFTIGGATTFNSNGSYYFYNGAVTISSPTANPTTLNPATYYVDSGALSITGKATFAAGTSTINLKSGSLTTAAGSSLTFTGGSSSQYTINAGGNGNGVTLGSAATFGAGTYYFNNGNVTINADNTSLGAGSYYLQSGNLAINANTSFGGGIYSLLSGSVTVLAGKTAAFAAGTSCTPSAPSGSTAGSCLYIANGSFTNNGTTTLAAGTAYLYAMTGSVTNAANATLTAGSGNLYVNAPAGAFANNGTATFGSGTALFNNNTPNNNGTGGFANAGTVTFTGGGGTGGNGSGSNYYFIGGGSTSGALNINAGKTAHFGPGTYYIVNGDLDIGTGATLDCANCAAGGNGMTFVLTQTASGGSIGTVQIPGDISVSAAHGLAAPGDGTYVGLLIFQDRNAALGSFNGGGNGSCSTNCNTLDGGNNMNFTGALYLPRAAVEFKGQSNASCLVLIAAAIKFSGNSSLTNSNCSTIGVKTVSSSIVGLTE
jgi:Flp pilus assembly protein TadG